MNRLYDFHITYIVLITKNNLLSKPYLKYFPIRLPTQLYEWSIVRKSVLRLTSIYTSYLLIVNNCTTDNEIYIKFLINTFFYWFFGSWKAKSYNGRIFLILENLHAHTFYFSFYTSHKNFNYFLNFKGILNIS